MRKLFLLLLLVFAAKSVHATATPIVCSNPSQTGNNADCLQPPAITYGNQGTSTASMAVTGSINNCSTTNIPACSGTGNLVLASTVFSLSGPNASDFAFSAGGCTSNLSIASGGNCQFTVTFTPTATAGTNESATLTIAYSGIASTTVALTGTSATVTTLSSSNCGNTLSNTVLYQASGNITCNGTGFYGQVVVLNLNGFTLTFNNTNQTTQTGAVLMNNFGGHLVVYNGTVSQGAGTNSYLPGSGGNVTNILSVFGPVNTNSVASYSFGDGNQFFNLTINYSFQYWNAINTTGPNTSGGNSIVHDVTVNDTAFGNCGQPGCRNILQSTPIVQPGTANNGSSHWYNNTINGSAQGGLGSGAPGAIVEHNLIFIGSNSGSAGTNTNNFGIYCWGGCTAHDNLVSIPLQTYSSGRGLQMAADGGSGNKSAYSNVIQAYSLADSTEYSGCQAGGTYGIQFDDNPQGTNNVNGNTINVFANACGASGLRLTDTEVTTNTSTNNVYNASRPTGATTCNMIEWTDPRPGCAMGVSISGNNSPTATAFTSTGDTFTADTGIICLCEGGAAVSSLNFNSSTFNKGSNPSATWHTFWASNGPSSPGSLYVTDATVGTGVSLTDAKIDAQGSNQGSASFYIQWTQSLTVNNTSAAPVSGALVTYTDTQSHQYQCTTNSSGVCPVVVLQYRLHNDTGANQQENHNPYARSVTATGCTNNNASNLTISAKNSVTVTLNCSGGSIPSPPGNFISGTSTGRAPYQVTLNWNASPTGGVTYNIYRTMSVNNTYTCPTGGIWPRIAIGVSTTTYVDASLGIGMWCYEVTATNGQESSFNTPIAVPVPPQGTL